jgi:hypothetical protein
MMFKAIALALLSILAATPLVSATVCAKFESCSLRNLNTGSEIKLTGVDSYSIVSGGSDANKYSIVCKVDYTTGESDFIKFFFDGQVQDEFGEPRWLLGDSDNGRYVVPVPYLSTCGKKTVKVQGNVWAKTCFEIDYELEAQCAPTPPAPVNPPVAPPMTAPMAPPMAAPVAPPTAKPVVPPTAKPVVPPTAKPVVPPTAKPVVPPTAKPVVPPTAKPVVPPVRLPTNHPVRPPVRLPTNHPVQPPVRPPAQCPNYVCPVNSCRIPGRACYYNFDDCQCNQGYKKVNGKCVQDCLPGFKLVSGYCVIESCHDDFHCPANSARIPGRQCYNNFDDCQCNSGWRKSGICCVRGYW